jgi:hypothetical protein
MFSDCFNFLSIKNDKEVKLVSHGLQFLEYIKHKMSDDQVL